MKRKTAKEILADSFRELAEYPVFTDVKEMLEYDCKDAAEAL